MSKNKFSALKKPLLIITGIGVVSAGTIFYLNKTRPGLILGATTSTKDYVGGKIPQSKIFLDKVFPLEEAISSEEETNLDSIVESENNNQDLIDQNNFFKESLEMTKKQLETLKDKSEEVKEHLINLSEEIKEASDGSQIHEKAFEYGQYIYCQQVVQEYQN
ncbi:MAG: hypothetical protein GW941_02235 [Candidatus Pacebacteria bacterium]|nr:hypothetical protein [Candidatus Paceibacterota bacterium]